MFKNPQGRQEKKMVRNVGNTHETNKQMAECP